jgi:hypothetical protein
MQESFFLIVSAPLNMREYSAKCWIYRVGLLSAQAMMQAFYNHLDQYIPCLDYN